MCSWDKFRLPTSVYPVYYDLHLALKSSHSRRNGEKDWWVVGEETIDVQVLSATSCIVLHSDETIKVQSATIDGETGRFG